MIKKVLRSLGVVLYLSLMANVSLSQEATMPTQPTFKLVQAESVVESSVSNNETDTNQELMVMDEKVKDHPIVQALGERVFSIGKVEVRDKTTDTKKSTGSGFVINRYNMIVTNYHVISNYYINPRDNKIAMVFSELGDVSLELLMVDVINDLALLRINQRISKELIPLEIEKRAPRIGDKIYSMGYPHGWGFTILDGLFNERIDKKYNDQYIVSSTLSPGMSGGPTLNEWGSVVAVNVAATNRLSIVIPANKISDLVNTYITNAANINVSEAENIKKIRAVTARKYSEYIDSLITEIKNPNMLSEQFECWFLGDGDGSSRRTRIQKEEKQCVTNSEIYIDSSTYLGDIRLNKSQYKNSSENQLLYERFIEKKYSSIIMKPIGYSCRNQRFKRPINDIVHINICTDKNDNVVASDLYDIRLNLMYERKPGEYQIDEYEFIGFNVDKIMDFLNFLMYGNKANNKG